jgi:hypothetical protein
LKKKLLIGLLVVLLALVGFVVSAILGINPLIETAVERGGTYALNVPNELGKADLALMSGDLELSGYTIANPEGFKTPAVFTVDEMNAAHLSLEATAEGTNVGVLLDNLQRVLPQPSGEQPEPTEEPAEEPDAEGQEQAQRRFVIDRLEITGTQVTLAQSVIGDTTFELTLPDLVLEQLGTEGEPVTLAEIMDTTLQGMVISVLNHEGLPPELRALLAGELDLSRLADELKAQLLSQLDGVQQRLDESLARGKAALDQGVADLQAQVDDAEAQAREQLDAAQADADEAMTDAQEQLDDAEADADEAMTDAQEELDDAQADLDDAKEKLGGLFGGSEDD